MRFFLKRRDDETGECRPCCGPCCVIARVVVRDCDRGFLVPGATVKVMTTGDTPDEVAAGETNDTGTVALLLPPAAGIKYHVEISGVVPIGSSEPDPQITRKKLIARCGVNTVEVDYNGVQEVCLNVVDLETGSPVSGIPVTLSVDRGVVTPREIGRAVSDGSGRACFDVEGGGVYTATANASTVDGTPPNTDYYGGSALLNVPNCGPFEEDLPIRLLDDHPGCLEIITKGCWCYLPGVSLTFHVRKRQPVTILGDLMPGTVATDHLVTVTSDSAGRAWLCLGEEFGLITLSGVYYDDDANEYVSLGITSTDVVPPSPYVPYMGIPPFTQGNGYYYTPFGIYTHSWTKFPLGPNGAMDGPPYQWCGNPGCTSDIPDEINVEISGDWPADFPETLTLTRDFSSSFTGCVDRPGGGSYVLRIDLPWSRYQCGPMIAERAGGELYRVGKACASDAIVGSESIYFIGGVPGSGTTACPTDFTMRSFVSVLAGGMGVIVLGDAYLSVTG